MGFRAFALWAADGASLFFGWRKYRMLFVGVIVLGTHFNTLTVA